MRKFFSIMVVILLSMTVLAGCGDNDDKEEIKPKVKPLVVAMELTHPPFEAKDDKDNPTGVSVDFARAFGDYIGREIIFENTSYSGLTSSLQEGRADMVISSMTITDEASKVVDFSEPYAQVMLAALVSTNSGITTVDTLNQKGKKVAVITGSLGSTYVQNNLPKAEIIVLANESQCTTEVAQGRADGFIDDELTIYKSWKDNADTTMPVCISLDQPEMWGVAVQKGNTELLAQVNEFIETYRVNEGFKKLTNKYLYEENASFSELGFKWIFDADQ